MSDYETNPYYNPEATGLAIVGTASANEPYEFDMIVVWKNADGEFLIGSDSGCSCPVPFEDTELNGPMTKARVLAELSAYMSETRVPMGEVVDLISKVIQS